MSKDDRGTSEAPSTTILVTYRKFGRARFVSHRDTERMWRRVLRRCRIPMELSHGFAPREKIQMGYPLSVGVESEGEDLLCCFREPVDPGTLRRLLPSLLPGGFAIRKVSAFDSRESLFSRVEALVYRVAGHDRPLTVEVEQGRSRNIRRVLVEDFGLEHREAMTAAITRVEVRYRCDGRTS